MEHRSIRQGLLLARRLERLWRLAEYPVTVRQARSLKLRESSLEQMLMNHRRSLSMSRRQRLLMNRQQPSRLRYRPANWVRPKEPGEVKQLRSLEPGAMLHLGCQRLEG